ncbi:ATP-binding protein [Streptomyces bambusae]
MLSLSTLPCPPVGSVLDGPPLPDNLFLSLTLAGSPHAARIARTAVAAALHVHGLAACSAAAVQVASELVGTAAKLSPGEDVYLSVRYRWDGVRLTVFDGQGGRTGPHAHPRIAAARDTARRSALRFMACVVRECGGVWGFEESREPGGDTRTWAGLPRKGAAAY